MVDINTASRGGPDYVQPAEPSDPSNGETWHDVDADPDGDGVAEGMLRVYDGDQEAWRPIGYRSHDNLKSVSPGDHHTRYSDSEARSAVDGSNISITGDAGTVDGHNAAELTPPIYGDGSDGSITRSGSGNEDGLLLTTDYIIQSGVTRTVSNGILLIYAQDYIEINGTLDADGQGGSGGSGAAASGTGDTGGNGSSGGSAALVSGEGLGGSGGDGSAGGKGGSAAGGGGGTGSSAFEGGDGGNAGSRTWSDSDVRGLRRILSNSVEDLHSLSQLGGAGGGGGGSGGYDGGAGGDGGNGGGIVVLVAPEIRGSGNITADGADGQDGNDGFGFAGGGGGGGGGGNGGAVIMATGANNYTGSATASGGAGGTGGAASHGGSNDGYPGGDGGDGATGLLIEMDT